MSDFTRDEALAFVEAIRLNLEGKTGFTWFADRLTSLSEYIESTAFEAEQLNAYVDSSGARSDFEAFLESDYPMDEAD